MHALYREQYHLYESCGAPTKPFPVPFPEDGEVYDYRFLKEDSGSWVLWADELKDVSPIPKDIPFNSIIIPTVDTIRYTYLMDMLVKHGKPCLFVGPTGTGKSVYIQVSVLVHSTVDKYICAQYSFAMIITLLSIICKAKIKS